MKVVLASNNSGKIRELQQVLKPLHLDLVTQAEIGIQDIEETGFTFIENALIKARHAARMSGLPALADDSGLVVNALHGAPGIYSARYAGSPSHATNNIRKLLTELKDVPDDKRQAYFYCILVFLTHEKDAAPLIGVGKWHGRILQAPSGDKGFGYDPVFYVPDEKKSAAELDPRIKNTISHRGIALQSLMHQFSEKS